MRGRGLGAAEAISYDGGLKVSLSMSNLSVIAFDRRTPNDELADGVLADLEPVVSKLFGTNATVKIAGQTIALN